MEQLTLFDLKTIKTWPSRGEITQARKALNEQADAMSRGKRRPDPVAAPERDTGFREQFSHGRRR